MIVRKIKKIERIEGRITYIFDEKLYHFVSIFCTIKDFADTLISLTSQFGKDEVSRRSFTRQGMEVGKDKS